MLEPTAHATKAMRLPGAGGRLASHLFSASGFTDAIHSLSKNSGPVVVRRT